MSVEEKSLENLIHREIQTLFWLANMLVYSETAASTAVHETFLRLGREFSRNGKLSSVRLYIFSYHTFHKYWKRCSDARVHVPPLLASSIIAANFLDSTGDAFYKYITNLHYEERFLLGLVFLLGWEVKDASIVVRSSEHAVRTQLEIFRSEFRRIIKDNSLSQERLDSYTREALQTVWPQPVLPVGYIDRQVIWTNETLHKEPKKFKNLMWLILLGLIFSIGLGFLMNLGLGALYVNLINDENKLTDLASLHPGATPVTPAPAARSLTRWSSPEAIRDRLTESSELWNTLWLDAQIYDYGPESYIGLPRIYRAQAWISQPIESVELFGLLSRKPAWTYITRRDHFYYTNPSIGEKDSGGRNPENNSLLKGEVLRSLVFPASEEWFAHGRFQAVRNDKVAGKEALIVNWFDDRNARMKRLWLDSSTGVILRYQEFGEIDHQFIVRDAYLTGIAYDQNEPPLELQSSLRLDAPMQDFLNPKPGGQVLMPTSTPALVVEKRPPPTPETVPIRYDPSSAALKFQFSRDPENSNLITGTAQVETKLIADGYLLGEGKFGLPWMLQCQRSPDGQRIAFNTFSDGVAVADDEIRWFNIKDPQDIFTPLKGIHAGWFAFAPDSKQLAVSGCGENQDENWIYIIDIGTGENRKLISLENPRNLLWSPDGEYIYAVGSLPGEAIPLGLVIHVRTGKIVHSAELELAGGLVPPDSPAVSWGLEIPLEMGGMDECAAIPQQ